jgi:hypothetical protein
MNSTPQTAALESFPHQPNTLSISRNAIWTGRVLSSIAGLFFLMDGVMKLVKPAPVVQATLQLGYPESSIVGIGVVLLVSTVLYVLPRTAIFGAILLTAYLGGAVATNVRVSAPWFNIFFPVLFGCFVWAGLYLRDRRVRSILS